MPLGLLLASADPVALDVTACDLMGIDPGQVRLIRECAAAGVGVADAAAVRVVGESAADHRRRFLLPHEALAAAFPGLVVHSSKACSCCMQNLFRALERAKGEGRGLRAGTVLIGPGPDSEAEVLVGRCAAQGRQCEPHVPGCPPQTEHIYAAIAADPPNVPPEPRGDLDHRNPGEDCGKPC